MKILILFSILVIAFGCTSLPKDRTPAQLSNQNTSTKVEKYVPDNTFFVGHLEISTKSENTIHVSLNLVNPKLAHDCSLSFEATEKGNNNFSGSIKNSEINLNFNDQVITVTGEPPAGYCGQGVTISGSYRSDNTFKFNHCVSVTQGGKDLVNCMNYEYVKANAKMNFSYSQLQKKLSANGKITLKNAQTIWLKFRENDCRFFTQTQSGEAAEFEKLACLTRMTETRVMELDYRTNPL